MGGMVGEEGEVMGEADGVEGGVVVAAAATVQPWAPKDTDELFSEIATMDYGVSDDRSSKIATPAIKAYNKVAGTYEQACQKRGQPLLDGFTIVKVRCMHRLRPVSQPNYHLTSRPRSGATGAYRSDVWTCTRFPPRQRAHALTAHRVKHQRTLRQCSGMCLLLTPQSEDDPLQGQRRT